MTQLRKIMCVEDDPDIRNILGWSLHNIGGYEVCLCDSGESALFHVKTFLPDMLLLDVMMPGLSGPQTLLALRDQGFLSGTTVLFLTAKSMQYELESLMELDVSGVIVKPFDPILLPNQISAYWQPHA
jgi:two-component system, OmpR family, response regulator